jgi:hypothetical protein
MHRVHVAEHEEGRLVLPIAADARDQVPAQTGRVVRFDRRAAPLELTRQTIRDRRETYRVLRGGFERDERLEERDAGTLELARARGQLERVDQGAVPYRPARR